MASGRLTMGAGRMMRIATRAIRRLPREFAARADGIVVSVQRLATREEGRTLGNGRRGSLLGMYRPEAGGVPDAVAIFRRPILRVARTRRQARLHVTVTAIHEFGHAVGLNEEAVAHL